MSYPHYTTECHERHPVLRRPVLAEVDAERARQDAKWGEQSHKDDTGYRYLVEKANIARRECDTEFASGNGSWRLILREEFAEALACIDPAELREELIQVAAVAVAWVEAIDRRTTGGES